MKTTGLQLRSLVKDDNTLEVSLAEVEFPEPGPDEVLVRVDATPINPSDLALLVGPADPATFRGELAGPVVPETEWSKWWTRARRAALQRFVDTHAEEVEPMEAV